MIQLEWTEAWLTQVQARALKGARSIRSLPPVWQEEAALGAVHELACAVAQGCVPAHPFPWVWRVARNLAIRECRRGGGNRTLLTAENEPAAPEEESLSGPCDWRELLASHADWIARHFTPLQRFLVNGLAAGETVNDLALATGLAPQNVRKLLRRGGRRFQEKNGSGCTLADTRRMQDRLVPQETLPT